MSSTEKVKLRCPACGAGFTGPPAGAERPLTCPKCSQVVTMELVGPAPAAAPVPPAHEEATPLAALAAAADAGRRPGSTPDAPAGICPACHHPLQPGALICTNCGRHLKTGLGIKTVVRAKKAGSLGLAVLAGGLAAVIAGAIWAGIAVVTEYEIGYVACGVGLLTGFAVCLTTRERSVRVGLMAAGLAVCGLLIGKLLIFQWAVPGFMKKEFAKDEKEMNELVVAVLLSEAATDPAVRAWVESDTDAERPSDPELAKKVDQIEKQVVKRFAAMTKEEKLDKLCDAAMENISLAKRIELTCSAFDILWFLLAIGAAWKMGAGTTGREGA